jgi:hypothetical protein
VDKWDYFLRDAQALGSGIYLTANQVARYVDQIKQLKNQFFTMQFVSVLQSRIILNGSGSVTTVL